MRCFAHFLGPIRVVTVAAALAAGLCLAGPQAVRAQQARPVQLPADARYGEMKAFTYPEATIGKLSLRLSPGARIYNTQNLIVMPATVAAPAQVLYKLDMQGQVSQMWLLTPEEAAAAKKRPVPKTP